MMDHGPPYRNRAEAGHVLADHLQQYRGSDAIVFAIPRGGVPVASAVAKKLGSKLDIIVARKIPIPYNTEAGYGAVTEDGSIILNEPLVRELKLTRHQIERQAAEIREEIKRRQSIYRVWLEPSSVAGKVTIIIDDGLASGYTMMAAVKSLRQQGAAKVIAAAPVASSTARELVGSVAEVVCPIVSYEYPFAVAGFYLDWYDLTDEEVITALQEFTKHYRAQIAE
jgi:putative phosphoribosyl transferase